MAKMWEFFENMDENVYVIDADQYELVYMNAKARKTYGISSIEEIKGCKCHEFLQHCLEPCSICNMQDLKPGEFKEWEYYNPILDKYMLLKDTIVIENGKTYRMEIAIDVSILYKRNHALSKYENMETLANEGLRIALQAPTPDRSIEIALEFIGKTLNAQRAYIFEKNEKGGDDNTYEWVESGILPMKGSLQNLPPHVCENWYQIFEKGQNIISKDLEDVRLMNSLLYDILKKQDIYSVVELPLYEGKRIIGFYGVDNPPADQLDYASNMLRIMGHFFSSTLRMRNLVRKLKNMSQHDQLTGFGNRHALNEYMKNLKKGECIGAVYCDVTGLKRVNDTKGHDAGDKLIISSCNCLRRVFAEYHFFRIGGDELLVLCRQITQKELDDKVVQLKADMQEHGVPMAVGASWKKDAKKNLDILFTEAETLMYKNKAEYYMVSGIDRRR